MKLMKATADGDTFQLWVIIPMWLHSLAIWMKMGRWGHNAKIVMQSVNMLGCAMEFFLNKARAAWSEYLPNYEELKFVNMLHCFIFQASTVDVNSLFAYG